MVKASLYNYRQSPRKVRLIANLVKGKSADKAVSLLNFTVKEASGPVSKLIQSALANAKNNFNLDAKDLIVKEIQVNGGATLRRNTPGARGRAFPIRKRTSHITLVLDSKPSKKEIRDSRLEISKDKEKGGEKKAKAGVSNLQSPISSSSK